MDIRNFSYLLEIVKHQNFTKAAENLHVSQPALSKMVKTMEDELGVTLFDRSGKFITLTDSGQAAVEQIRIIMQAVGDLYTTLDDVAHLKTGTIVIGLPPVISSVFFPRFVTKFQQLYPNIKFQIVEEGSKKVESLITNGRIDVGVVIAPVDEPNLEALPFLFEELALVVHKSHPLANADAASLQELSEEGFILFAQGFSVRNHVIRACHSLGFSPNIVYESSQWDLLVEMVAANLGISILPKPICSKITSSDVQVVPLANPSIPWNLVVIWNKDRYLSHAIREFISYIEQNK